MTVEQFPNQEVSQDERNQSLLEESELGVLLMDSYRTATDLDPRLAEMLIVPIDDPDEKKHGFATAADVSESGKHEIHIRLDNLDETLEYYAQAIRDYPMSVEIVSKRLNLDPSEVTPQMLYVQSNLHEMGHVVEHMDFENNMDALRLRNKQEREALPLGYHSLTQLMDPSSELRTQVDAHWDEISSQHGVEDIHGLARLQGEQYRDLTSEKHADMFAADVFDINPQLATQLLQPTVEPYRNFPMAA